MTKKIQKKLDRIINEAISMVLNEGPANNQTPQQTGLANKGNNYGFSQSVSNFNNSTMQGPVVKNQNAQNPYIQAMNNTTNQKLAQQQASRTAKTQQYGAMANGVNQHAVSTWPQDAQSAMQFVSQYQNSPKQGAGWLKNMQSMGVNDRFIQHLRGVINNYYKQRQGNNQTNTQNTAQQTEQPMSTQPTQEMQPTQQMQPTQMMPTAQPTSTNPRNQRKANRIQNRISRQQQRMAKAQQRYSNSGIDYTTPKSNGGYGGSAYSDIQQRQNRINKLQGKLANLQEAVDRAVRSELRRLSRKNR